MVSSPEDQGRPREKAMLDSRGLHSLRYVAFVIQEYQMEQRQRLVFVAAGGGEGV